MKLILAVLLMMPVMATAATEIIYNRTTNPYVPTQGMVTSSHVCLDKKSDSLRVYVPAKTVEVCDSIKTDFSDSKYPRKVCVGRKDVSVPAKSELTSRFTKEKICVRWNSDSTHPACLDFAEKTVEYPTTYTQYTYDVADPRKERPIDVVEKEIESCDN